MKTEYTGLKTQDRNVQLEIKHTVSGHHAVNTRLKRLKCHLSWDLEAFIGGKLYDNGFTSTPHRQLKTN